VDNLKSEPQNIEQRMKNAEGDNGAN
jgi:hypothetical protein